MSYVTQLWIYLYTKQVQNIDIYIPIHSPISVRAPSIQCPEYYYFFVKEIAILRPPLRAPREGFRLTSVGLITRFLEIRSISSSCSSESRGRFSLITCSEGGLELRDELDELGPLEVSEDSDVS